MAFNRTLFIIFLVATQLSSCEASANCSEPSSECVFGSCVTAGLYSFCECPGGRSGARCQYSTNCNGGNGRCDGTCLPSGLCNCTNGLVGSHCNQLPTGPGFTFDRIRQLIEPCHPGSCQKDSRFSTCWLRLKLQGITAVNPMRLYASPSPSAPTPSTIKARGGVSFKALASSPLAWQAY